jgi:hypothetical protein
MGGGATKGGAEGGPLVPPDFKFVVRGGTRGRGPVGGGVGGGTGTRVGRRGEGRGASRVCEPLYSCGCWMSSNAAGRRFFNADAGAGLGTRTEEL